MIHPNTCLKFISEEVGYGLFATDFIPAGTVTYVKDSLEIEVDPEEFQKHNSEMQAAIERYSYIDERGIRIVSWDLAKYVNHCCQCNTMSTGYGFEIALRNIQAGEQITDEYGLFNLQEELTLDCSMPGCRKTIGPKDFDLYYSKWDESIKEVLPLIFEVEQPLWNLVSDDVKQALSLYQQDSKNYLSVYNLKYYQPLHKGAR